MLLSYFYYVAMCILYTYSEGASIVVVGQSLSVDLTEQLYNPQCFLQYAVPTAPPPTWKVCFIFMGLSSCEVTRRSLHMNPLDYSHFRST